MPLLAAVCFAVQPVLLQLFVQRVAINAEAAGGFDLYTLAFIQNLRDRFSLDRIDDPAVDVACTRTSLLDTEVHELFGERIKIERDADRPWRTTRRHGGRKQLKCQLIARGHNDGTLDIILQFADVAWP